MDVLHTVGKEGEAAKAELVRISKLVTVPLGQSEQEFRAGMGKFVESVSPEGAAKIVEVYKSMVGLMRGDSASYLAIAGLQPADMLVGAMYEGWQKAGETGQIDLRMKDQLAAGVVGAQARGQSGDETIRL